MEGELDEGLLRLEDFCELDIASDRGANGLERGTEPGEDPRKGVVVIMWREFDAEVANRCEVCKDVIEKAEKV